MQRGDIVLLKDKLAPPGQWHLGTVSNLYTSRDGLFRAVTVKTAQSQYIRSVVKYVRLPVNDSMEDLLLLKPKG